MLQSIRLVVVALALSTSVAFAADGQGTAPAGKAPAQKDEKCEHGVTKSICARCNPKLAAVFKSKGDWCAEHERPESQCVLCHPELAKKGIK